MPGHVTVELRTQQQTGKESNERATKILCFENIVVSRR